MLRVPSVFILCGCLCLVGSACLQPTAEGEGSSGGSSGGSGGKGGSGGSGGTTATGGTTANGGSGGSGGSGGTTANGGSSGSGGTTANGGSGGNVGSGGRGGSSGSGGTTANGGSGGGGGRGGTTTSGGGGGGGGRTGSGGRTGNGGSSNTGGTTNNGGTTSDGGTTTSGGSSGNGGSAGGGGSADCSFTQTATKSTKIQTVVTVAWSSTLSNMTSAKIDFGLDTSYGMTAPVEKPASGSNNTLLLGMKANKTYHYRITATGSGGNCVSPDYTTTTGALLNTVPKITATTKSTASPLFGGFLITGQFLQMGGTGAPAYIMDKDTEPVWAIAFSKDVTGAVMNYAGTHMWINCAQVPQGTTCVHRYSMDGNDEDLSSKFTGLNHQLTVLPDETVAFYAYGSNGCEDIKEYNPSTGNVKTIVNAGTATGSSPCHCNNIQYSKEDDTLVFSELDAQAVVKIKRSDGSVVWRLNGKSPTISGVSWSGGEHGIHVMGLDNLLIFNNGSNSGGSIAIELKLNISAKTASQTWSYKANPAIYNQVMGDLQRLPNGNTFIGYSTKGVAHEVSSSGTLLQELAWPGGSSFGYIQKRATLYGPPPR